MRISNWTNQEIKKLFETVEKESNRYAAFSKHAEKFGRRTNSVRNFYYAKVKETPNGHKVSKPIQFDEAETHKLIEDINLAISKGKSVRSACLELSGNNPSLMLRMQNKYRSIIKKPAAASLSLSTKKRDIPTNIIKLPKKEKDLPLTDQDLANLFMGIIRLVKNNNEKTK